MYYVTKYALTDGIWIVEEDPELVNEKEGYLYIHPKGRGLMPMMQIARADFFRTKEEAEARVAQLVAKKIKSINKSMEKLKNYKAPTRVIEKNK